MARLQDYASNLSFIRDRESFWARNVGPAMLFGHGVEELKIEIEERLNLEFVFLMYANDERTHQRWLLWLFPYSRSDWNQLVSALSRRKRVVVSVLRYPAPARVLSRDSEGVIVFAGICDDAGEAAHCQSNNQALICFCAHRHQQCGNECDCACLPHGCQNR